MSYQESKEQKFHGLYQKAKKLRQAGHYRDARKEYMHMLDQFSINQVDYTDYISVMADLGDIEKHLNNFVESKKIYLKAIAYLNEAKRYSQRVSEYEIQKEKYHLYSNLGLLLCSEAQLIQEKNANYDNLRKIIDQSLSYYRTCEQIVVDMIIERDKIEGDDQNITWWRNQYIAVIINMLNSLEIEGFQFKDKKTMDLMVELIERAENFYKLCPKKADLETNLSKCYYFKALCYRFLGKKNQSQIYFKKDYNYCLQNNQKEDLQKTRVQIIKFFMANFNFTQAKTYTKNAQYLAEINQAEKQYFDLMRKLLNMETDFGKGIEVYVDDLENLLYELNEKNCNKKAFDFNKKARNTPQFKQNVTFRYWLEYYASETCFKLQQYTESLKFINQAYQLANNQLTKNKPVEITWCLLQKAIVMDKTENDRRKVYDTFRQCIQNSKQCGDQDCQNQCAAQFEEFKMRQKRRNRDFKLDDKCSKGLFEYLDKKKKRKEQMRNQEIRSLSSESNPISSEKEDIFEPRQRLVKASNPLSKYIQNCRILGVEPLQKFKEILKDNTQVDLASMIYFPTEQILALIVSSPFIPNLDLRNFILTPGMLQGIRESETCPNIKSLKLNMINASIHNTKDEVFEQLSELLSKIPFLENFTITNLYKLKQIQLLIDANHSVAFQGLKVLKLKQCQIEDKDLLALNLGEKLPQLKKLSLSDNKLDGQTIQALVSLKDLEQLSLSKNPLSNMSLTKSFQNLKKLSLKNMQRLIQKQTYQGFIPLIINCQILNFEGSTTSFIEILNVLVEYLIQYEIELPSLRQLIMFGAQFKGQELINLLWRLERKAPNLRLIDIRCCSFVDVDQNVMILQEIGNFENTFMRRRHDSGRMEEQNPQKPRDFKFQNTKMIQSDDPRLNKTFNIN